LSKKRFSKHFTWKRLRTIEIHSNDPLRINLDGETFFDTAILVEVIPAGIRFVTPGGIEFQKRVEMDEHHG
jgi:diacylglycerol kinase family enzyme